jgi:hypothetical protein
MQNLRLRLPRLPRETEYVFSHKKSGQKAAFLWLSAPAVPAESHAVAGFGHRDREYFKAVA